MKMMKKDSVLHCFFSGCTIGILALSETDPYLPKEYFVIGIPYIIAMLHEHGNIDTCNI